jgi:hypothetical protein
MQARIADIATRVGWFVGSLYFDRVMGHQDTPDRVKLRAADLRCGGSGRSAQRASKQLPLQRIS